MERTFTERLEKYGSDNFEFVIIERCDKTQLNQREMYWIEQYDSFNNGYNKTIGGDGAKHITPWNKGLKLNEEYRRKLSESHKGHIHTEEHKSKISAKVAGENNPNYGKTGINSSRGVCIYCETLNVYFGSYASAEYILLKDYGIKIGQHTIADAAKGLKKTNTAGKTADGVPLVWRIVPEEEKNKNIKLIINN